MSTINVRSLRSRCPLLAELDRVTDILHVFHVLLQFKTRFYVFFYLQVNVVNIYS